MGVSAVAALVLLRAFAGMSVDARVRGRMKSAYGQAVLLALGSNENQSRRRRRRWRRVV